MMVVKPKINIVSGKESVLDLTLVSNYIAAVCYWKVYKEGTIGSDHYPILCKINNNPLITGSRDGKFGKANWEVFKKESDRLLLQIDYMDIEVAYNKIKEGILKAALVSIPKSKGKVKRKMVQWWHDMRKEAVRNRAFKVLKRSLNLSLIRYKKSSGGIKEDKKTNKKNLVEEIFVSIGNKTTARNGKHPSGLCHVCHQTHS